MYMHSSCFLGLFFSIFWMTPGRNNHGGESYLLNHILKFQFNFSKLKQQILCYLYIISGTTWSALINSLGTVMMFIRAQCMIVHLTFRAQRSKSGHGCQTVQSERSRHNGNLTLSLWWVASFLIFITNAQKSTSNSFFLLKF